ncbi:putative MFS family arabinose efflux permease [Kribbella orskensis]|uniref:MFS family arabinose efflux permease n=1 Tax=Kribbella orskensis TaxID=2512216 RepID=A0ABY2BQ63_9ACTN|nr:MULTISPECIES: MFS transporter [Kribbella]TCN41161.1 putative MFS family arabinose efflux permease [Kribbella sp. VKM Ac-2500]TCO24413.1 putative MFS family arabinose efflux permease [Kribbella orskensis]
MLRTAATVTDTGSAGTGGRRGGARPDVVAALAVSTTIGYGVLYYAFSVLLEPMSTDLGISAPTVTGALTLAVLVSAALAIPVGRWLDRHGGHALMTAGSLLGAAAVLAWSQVQTAFELYGVFVAVGAASAMVLYQPAFAVIVAVTAAGKRTNALLGVTLVAGFASSIFIPLTGLLVHAYGWRSALGVLALIVAVVTVPLHAVALRGTRPVAERESRSGSPGRVLRDLGFWLLAFAFVLHGAALAIVAVHLVVFLTRLGHSATVAASLTGLLGLLSVTGRVLTTVLQRWLRIASITAAIIALQAAAIGLLPFIGRTVAGAAGCLVLFGLGFGVASIAIPAILLDRYGDQNYATIAGILSTPITIARATAPLGAAVIATTVGYRSLILATAAICLTAAAALALTLRLGRPPG